MESCSFLPIESNTLLPEPMLHDISRNCRLALTQGDVDKLVDDAARQKVLLGQLRQSIVQASSDLVKLINKRKSDATKKQKEEKDKQVEQAKVSQQVAADAEKKRLSKTKRLEPLRVPYEKIGFKRVPIVDEAKVADFKSPFIVRGCQAVSDFAEDSANVLKGTLDRWCQLFESSSFAKKNDVVQAPILDTHGHDELLPLGAALLETIGEVKSANPELAKSINRWELFGQTAFLLSSDFEEHCMAVVRVQVVGSTEMVLFPITTAKEILVQATKDWLAAGSDDTPRSYSLVFHTDAGTRDCLTDTCSGECPWLRCLFFVLWWFPCFVSRQSDLLRSKLPPCRSLACWSFAHRIGPQIQ